VEWVEVRGSSVDVAVEAALAELGLSSRDEAKIEIMEEPTKGFLGMGSREALVRVSPKPKTEKRPRRRKRGGSGGGEGRQESREGGNQRDRSKGGQSGQGARGGRDRDSGSSGGRKPRSDQSGRSDNRGQASRADSEGGRKKSAGGGRDGRDGRDGRSSRQGNQRAKERAMDDTTTPEVEIDAEGQATVVAEFLNGLLNSFGLEGDVTTSVDDDLIVADVAGEQTEALIGQKGSIMQSVGELTRTVVQRKTHRRARLRLDIGGYQERRREALRIYTARLAEQVLADGGELMLEPMNPADRKTVHDAVVDIEGVSSFSEGEEPNRSVVISLAPGVKPTGETASTESGTDDVADTGSDGSDDSDDDGDGDAGDE